jgi:membrane associated rhomboid family serine protease
VTYAIMALCAIAFLASGQFGVEAHGTSLYRRFAIDGPDIATGHEYWRLITGGFLHAGFLHIGFNMYLLYVLGRMLEPALGSVKFGLLYFAALLAGSAGALVVTPLSYTVGASGAVFGLMGAAFIEMRSRGIDPMAGGILGSIGGLILINLVFSFALSGISVGGHIGGLIGGGLVALAYGYADRARRPALAYAGAIAVAVASAAIGIAAAGGSGL